MREIKICEFQSDVGFRECFWSHCSRSIFYHFYQQRVMTKDLVNNMC